jgi:hypothetical protein
MPDAGTGLFTKPCYSKCILHTLKLRLRLLLANRSNKLMARQRNSRCNLWIAIVPDADSPSLFDDLDAALRSHLELNGQRSFRFRWAREVSEHRE